MAESKIKPPRSIVKVRPDARPAEEPQAAPATPRSAESAETKDRGESAAPPPTTPDPGAREPGTEPRAGQTGATPAERSPEEPAPADAPGPDEAPAAPTPRRRRREGPRRVRNGIKYRRKEAHFPFPAGRWKDALLSDAAEAALIAGEDYARQGQVTSFAIIVPDLALDAPQPRVTVQATVQGSAPRPYATSIEIASWTRAQWERAVEAMAREAIYSAKLLAGELPAAVEELCASLGASLLPRDDEGIVRRCTCPEAESQPCKHLVAIALLLAERLADAPLAAFNLRGLPHETALARLHEARALHTHGHSAAHGAAAQHSAGRPFEACLVDFWRPGPQLSELERPESAEHVPHALLRRLGPSPFPGRFPLVGLLASIYDSVREEARRIRGDL